MQGSEGILAQVSKTYPKTSPHKTFLKKAEGVEFEAGATFMSSILLVHDSLN